MDMHGVQFQQLGETERKRKLHGSELPFSTNILSMYDTAQTF